MQNGDSNWIWRSPLSVPTKCRQETSEMSFCRFENISVWSKVGKIIGWIGIAIGIFWIPLFCYIHGFENIVYAMIHKYGLHFTKVWAAIISISYGEFIWDFMPLSIYWFWLVIKKNSTFRSHKVKIPFWQYFIWNRVFFGCGQFRK